MSGSSSSPHVHDLRPALSATMHVRVTSAPVPDVVGIATIGRRPGNGAAHSKYGSTPPSPALTTAACLAMSSAEPPPTPITIASPAARTTVAAASTDSSVGSPHGTMCSVTGRGLSAATTLAMYPAASTP